jgi:hypothetical protein
MRTTSSWAAAIYLLDFDRGRIVARSWEDACSRVSSARS